MRDLTSRQKRVTIAVLSTIVLLGAILRLYDITARTITHSEIYVPGIELPAALAAPGPRFTIGETVDSVLLEEEPHPPTYYLIMLGWTKLFGSSVLALRLPSALLGIASILLVWVLGLLEKNWIAALLAAAMLAFNGWHMLWSQLAKNYVVASFLGLLSTVLLVWIARDGARRLWLHVLYVGVTTLGLVTTVWFWPVLAVHLLWVWMHCRDCESMPGLMRSQFTALALGSPALSLAIFQSRRPGYLDPPGWGLSQFLQFGSLFERDPFATPQALPALVQLLLAFTALVLLGCGLGSDSRGERRAVVSVGFPSAAIGGAGFLSFLAILGMARITGRFDAEQTRLVVASSVLPLLLLALYFLFQRYWSLLQELVFGLNKKAVASTVLVLIGVGAIASALLANLFGLEQQAGFGPKQMSTLWSGLVLVVTGILSLPFLQPYVRAPDSLSSLLAILPVAMLAVISPIVSLVAARGLLLYSPYLLLVLAKGLVALSRRTRLWIAFAVVLAIIHPLSVLYFKQGHHRHPTDYKALAEQWTPEIRDNDLIFIRRYDSITTPIFYYLKPGRYYFVGYDYADAARESPGSRIWFLFADGHPMPPEMKEALSGYHLERMIRVFRVQAELYVGSGTGAAPGMVEGPSANNAFSHKDTRTRPSPSLKTGGGMVGPLFLSCCPLAWGIPGSEALLE